MLHKAQHRKALDTDSWETSVLMGLVTGEFRTLSPDHLSLPAFSSLPSGDPLSSFNDEGEIAKNVKLYSVFFPGSAMPPDLVLAAIPVYERSCPKVHSS